MSNGGGTWWGMLTAHDIGTLVDASSRGERCEAKAGPGSGCLLGEARVPRVKPCEA